MTSLTRKIISELKLQLFGEEDNSGKTILAIYPGRFQPMGLHHKAAYDWLVKKFGKENTYIVTSNITDPKDSPFTFLEKKAIINKYGIDKVIKSDRPYFPSALIKKYDPETTVVVFMIGEKDHGRLSSIKRLMKYNKTTAVPYKDAENPFTYYLYCPTFRYNIPDFGEMSGTTIRKALSDKSATLAQLKLRFENIMGWFDAKIFNMIIGKLNSDHGKIRQKDESRSLPIVSRKFWNEVFSEVASEDLINESGLGGHIPNLFEDYDLTFGDLKEIFKSGLDGEITLGKAPTEKVDGMNLFVTFKDGKLFAARNKSDIKSGGMSYKDIDIKFKNKPEVKKAYLLAFTDLETAFNTLTDDEQILIFKNGTAWMNLEVIYPKNVNVINYDGAYIVFHGSATYDDSGNKKQDYPSYATKLSTMITKVNANTQKTFNLSKPNKVSIVRSKDFEEQLEYFTTELDKMKVQCDCKDTDSIKVWLYRWWRKFIGKHIAKEVLVLDERAMEGILNRWSASDKSFELTKTNIPDEATLRWVKSIDKYKVREYNERNLRPLESLILKFGAEVLRNVKDVMALNPDKTVQKIKVDVDAAIKILSTSTDVNDIELLRKQLERIKAAGGMKAIAPIEGITFNFKGKPYKLTGVFGPINQLLGHLKYDR